MMKLVSGKPPGYVYITILLAMFFWGLSFVWTSIVFKYYSPITTIFLRVLISSVILYTGLKLAGKLEPISRKDLPLFLLSALFNPFLYFLGESYGLKYSSATISAVIIVLIPVVTAIFSYFILDEIFTSKKIIGMMVVILGVFLSQMRFKRKMDGM